ncbi:MAG: UDP-N-acetylglucosamine 1-carboxyvinyltransferase [Symbiobacterium thermophilum]|uniref:UDP-N-acetylglucosamine 1-carboxyvinyltransferase n=1 Tax=Symbiobacterium thermophilum TaxID=2734 RepID=A0A1Y2T6K5_SYMTR|nr:MAG: UDP-N-acetylglucosamine 1-carboxyvinyltransferase [Symbiobacterium thermophilum]PZN73202.1 MAG: UDP-N-acetylglucosamine 1-carboxyvinyltransferase [Bacillota bacterium]
MTTLRIRGGRPLKGTIRVGGRKNATLPLIAATLLADGTSRLENVPQIHDVVVYRQLLTGLGARVDWDPVHGILTVHTDGVRPGEPDYQLASSIRASYYLLGVMLARYGRASVPMPGGDRIGHRPVDQHFKGLSALGAEIWVDRGIIHARARRLRGANVYLDIISVGATIQVMLAASLAEGTTVIQNCAKEPHVVAVANFINACGGKVTGAGTDTIRVRGVDRLVGATQTVIPDDIEAGTWMMAAAMTQGDVILQNVIPTHMTPIMAKLREAGVEIHEMGDAVRVIGRGRPKAVNVKTLPYPGFPTDAQNQMTALLSLAEGTSYVTETLYEDRFRFVPELLRMGAQIRVEGRTAIVKGVERLYGAPVEATDIRAGAALVIAGLAAEGETTIYGMEHVQRGYEKLEEKLLALGADVKMERKGAAAV